MSELVDLLKAILLVTLMISVGTAIFFISTILVPLLVVGAVVGIFYYGLRDERSRD